MCLLGVGFMFYTHLAKNAVNFPALAAGGPIWVNAPTLPPHHTLTSDNPLYVNQAERDGTGLR